MRIIRSFQEALLRFWEQHPALLYALFLLLGFQLAFFREPILFMPGMALTLPLLFSSKKLDRLRIGLGLCLTITAWFWGVNLYQFPAIPQGGIQGQAYIDISSVSLTSNHFGKRWTYRGTLHRFISEEGKVIARRIPYTIHIPANAELTRPTANKEYLITGRLKESAPGRYHIIVGKHTPWHPIAGSWGFAEMRFDAKNAIGSYIKNNIANNRAGIFLTGIATGYFDDHLMSLEFSRFGLQHIMAISGFHFAIIAGFFGFLLRLFVNREVAAALLTFLLSGYFLFLGCAPSVMRAWISIVVVLVGYLLRRESSGLNTLGVALMITLLFDPLFCWNLGFQFSFIATAAILLLYPACDLILQSSLTKRSLSELVEMNRATQHAYCLLTSFRQALALTLAVNLITLPIMLYHFQRFPLLSLIHNLFFPFLVSISMILLVLASLAHPFLPPIASIIHNLNSFYTKFVLDFTYKLPKSLDIVWITSIPLSLLTVYLVLAFGFAIYVRFCKMHR